MADLKTIKKRIGSVQNTRQITRAMKMVSAAKLRRAQEGIMNARPYSYRIYSILLTLFKKEGIKHPLLTPKEEEKKIRLIVLAGDRGLCGSFNTNIFKASQRFMNEKRAQGVEVTLDVIGKKAYDFYKKKENITTYHEGLMAKPMFSKVAEIGTQILNQYLEGEFDAIYLIYNEFKSAIQQTITVERLIPVATEIPDGVLGITQANEADQFKNYIFEPSIEEILNEIVPRHFKVQLFRAVLESVASEHGARMSAMENATKNASEMIDRLTLSYNKARQEKITTELMEIVGGVEAMR